MKESINESYRINGLKFGLLSPKEIEDISVLEINNINTFEGGEPIKEGLFDLKLGPIDESAKCATCLISSWNRRTKCK